MEKTVYRQPRRGPGRALAGLRRRLRAAPALDLPFLAILLALVCLGLVVLFSAGYAVALYRRGDAYTYIRPQLLFAALGVAAMYAASFVDYHVWHRLAWPLMGLSLLLLAVVLFMPEYNGCKRWIVLPGLGTLQPSEIAKFSVVLVFSHIISLNHDRMKTFTTGVLPFAVILAAVTVLMLLEPHLSGTLLILGIGAVLMFVGGTGLKWFGLAGAAAAAAIAAAVILLPELVPYAADRLASWQDPFADPLGEGHQTIQSLYAIASGGIAGLGLGNSRQKYLYVPEPQNDFIFSILCEELGFVGAAVVIGLFLLLLLRGMSIAVRAKDRFGALLVVGFVVQVILQAVLNIAVVTNTIPNTGISLPFFSSGGTSLMMLLGEMGIVLSVSRQADAA
ncbi:MAG TPA: putative lipid II flippase FtsW [Candidatus Gemmiger stercorigallinarum]|nr:putative lipid II flippase FtsW [Candidatus Gemmiger stercorigallinarum]